MVLCIIIFNYWAIWSGRILWISVDMEISMVLQKYQQGENIKQRVIWSLMCPGNTGTQCWTIQKVSGVPHLLLIRDPLLNCSLSKKWIRYNIIHLVQFPYLFWNFFREVLYLCVLCVISVISKQSWDTWKASHVVGTLPRCKMQISRPPCEIAPPPTLHGHAFHKVHDIYRICASIYGMYAHVM